jgi:hypothetical protein
LCEDFVVRQALAQLEMVVEDCQSAALSGLSADDLLDCLDACGELVSRVAAVQARVIARVELTGLARTVGASSARALVRDRLRLRPSEAKRLCDLATALDRLEVLAAGVADGRVNAGQAATIAAALDDLPTEVGPQAYAKAEAHLVDLAGQFDPDALRILGRRLAQVVDPRVGRPA